MRHLKEYNEFYDGEDLQDLVDTLAGVGLADKFKVECNVFIMVPSKGLIPYEWPEWAFSNIEVEVSCSDDRKIILEGAFEKVLKGEFTQESNTYLDQMFKSAPELVPVLSKEHMLQLAKKVRSNPNLATRESDLLSSLQFLLTEEIEGLMVNRTSGQRELEHLDENIGYNVRITKI